MVQEMKYESGRNYRGRGKEECHEQQENAEGRQDTNDFHGIKIKKVMGEDRIV